MGSYRALQESRDCLKIISMLLFRNTSLEQVGALSGNHLPQQKMGLKLVVFA